MSSHHKCRTIEARARRQKGAKEKPSAIHLPGLSHVPSVPGSTATEVMGIHRRLFKKMQAPKRPGFPVSKAGILHDALEAKVGGQPVYMRDGNTGTIYRVQPKAGKSLCRTLQGGW